MDLPCLLLLQISADIRRRRSPAGKGMDGRRKNLNDTTYRLFFLSQFYYIACYCISDSIIAQVTL